MSNEMLVGIPPCVLLMSRREKRSRQIGLRKYTLLFLSKLLMVSTRYSFDGLFKHSYIYMKWKPLLNIFKKFCRRSIA